MLAVHEQRRIGSTDLQVSEYLTNLSWLEELGQQLTLQEALNVSTQAQYWDMPLIVNSLARFAIGQINLNDRGQCRVLQTYPVPMQLALLAYNDKLDPYRTRRPKNVRIKVTNVLLWIADLERQKEHKEFPNAEFMCVKERIAHVFYKNIFSFLSYPYDKENFRQLLEQANMLDLVRYYCGLI